MPEKPRRSASRATSRVSCRRPGTATRLKAGNASDIQARSKRFTTEIEISQRLPRRSSRECLDLSRGEGRDPFVGKLVYRIDGSRSSPGPGDEAGLTNSLP